jgi:hypothetical protein
MGNIAMGNRMLNGSHTPNIAMGNRMQNGLLTISCSAANGR